MQTRPQETPLANANSKAKGLEQIHTVQQRGDMLARRLDGPTSDVQGAPQLMHEESQGSRSETPNRQKDIRGSTRELMGRPGSLRLSLCTVWERALVGSERNRRARRPPTSLQWTSQIRAGRAAHDPEGGTNEGVRVHTCGR